MTEMAPDLRDWPINTQQTAEIIEFPRLPVIPKAENYARLRFEDAFDVPGVLHLAASKRDLPSGHVMYVVDFASQKIPGVSEQLLSDLDDNAHREAAASDGFLIYYRGDPDEEGWCRSFCVWESVQSGILSAKQQAHRRAVDAVDDLYLWYQVTMREAWLDDSPQGYGFGLARHHSSDGIDHLLAA